MVMLTKVILAISSVGLILVVLLQSGKSAGLSGTISGGAEQLVGKTKARGIDAVLGKLTMLFAVLFMLSAIVLGFFLKKIGG